MPRNKHGRFAILLLTMTLFLLFGNLSLTLPNQAFGFSFAVMGDPHGASDSWINSLREARDMTINPEPKFSRPEFLLITGDTNPIDLRYGEFTEVFKDSSHPPLFLPIIGNHEFDDNGGTPGGRPGTKGASPDGPGPSGMGAPPQRQESPGMGSPQEGPPERTGSSSSTPDGVVQVPGNPPGRYPDNGDPSIIDIQFIKEKIISALPGVVSITPDSCSYYYDHQNIRVISLDGFSGEIGQQGIINEAGIAWTEAVIESAPGTIDHIFIAFHAPAFPRVRHTHDSFNADAEQRNAFWNMLIAHQDKVRAVFSGHTHYYNRMRVFDPAGAGANDFTVTPHEAGGIYQVNVGSTGNGMKTTFLKVEVNEKKVLFRAYEAENGKEQPFTVMEEWRIEDQ